MISRAQMVLQGPAVRVRRFGAAMVVALTFLGAGLGLTAGAASAAPLAYGPTPVCSISVSVFQTGVGSTVSVHGQCGDGTYTLRFYLHSDPVYLGSATSNSDGGFSSVPIAIPSDTAPGMHEIVVVNPEQGLSAETSIDILGTGTAAAGSSASGSAASTGSSSNGLAFTGIDVGGLVLVAAVAIGLGGVLVLSSRKRRRQKFTA